MRGFAVLAGLTIALAAASSTAVGAEYQAITKPSKDAYLSFVRPGNIDEVAVEAGDHVAEGEVLIRQDDEAERLELERLEAEADNTTSIEASEARLDQKRVDLARLQRAARHGAATDLEVDNAKLEVTIGELSLKLAKFELAQKRRELAITRVRVDQMRLESPFDGIVETIAAKEGESVEAQQRILRVVKIDPLWIDVPASLDEARDMKVGEPATVIFPGGESVTGKIMYLAAVADAASNTRTVRVEAPNPDTRPAGETVDVRFGSDHEENTRTDDGRDSAAIRGGEPE